MSLLWTFLLCVTEASVYNQVTLSNLIKLCSKIEIAALT